MRTLRTGLTTALTALLALGALAAPAGANVATGTSSDGGSTLTVDASDLLAYYQGFGSDRALMFTVDVPDPYMGADGKVVATTWSLTVAPTDTAQAATCPVDRSRVYTQDRDGNPLVSDRSFSLPFFTKGYGEDELPVRTGRCDLSATLSATRAGDATHPAYTATTTVAAHQYVRTLSWVTIESRITVYKDREFTVAGLARYQKPSAGWDYVPVPRLTKVTVEFQPTGSTTWKAIKATYVTGTAGRFATAVKVPGSGSLRTVVLSTPRILTNHSQEWAVTAK